MQRIKLSMTVCLMVIVSILAVFALINLSYPRTDTMYSTIDSDMVYVHASGLSETSESVVYSGRDNDDLSLEDMLSNGICTAYIYIEGYLQPDEILIFSPDELTLDNLLVMANRRRQVIHVPDMEQIQKWINSREPITLDGTRLFGSERTTGMSAEDAAEDINTFFELLRHIYAAYHHFGGDEVFIPLRDDMLEEIANNERWTDTQLAELIQNRLGEIIADYHFIVNTYSGSTFGNPHYSFILDIPFDRSERGFRMRDTGMYVLYAQEHDIYNLFRLTMNEYGKLFYAPFIFRRAAEGTRYILNITFEDGSQISEELTRITHRRTHPRGETSSLRFENGIPIVSIRRMGDSFNPYALRYQEAVQVLSYADQLRNEPIIIVDIRSNEGGASAFSYKWLYKLTGELVPANHKWLGLHDTEILTQRARRPQSWYRGFSQRAGFDFQYPPELFGRYLHMEPIGNNITFTAREAWDRVIQNDQVIIVLIDRFTISAGETFADQFSNIKNTLIIGQNTFGMLLTSSGLPLYLPNSGIPVRMGRFLLYHPDGVWEEGVGIAPDIWVTGDALSAALALLNQTTPP